MSSKSLMIRRLYVKKKGTTDCSPSLARAVQFSNLFEEISDVILETFEILKSNNLFRPVHMKYSGI